MSEPTNKDHERAKSYITVAQGIAAERERIAKKFESLAQLPLSKKDKEGLQKGANLVRSMAD